MPMALSARNKSTLAQRQREWRSYEQVLPSLDMKRRQLAVLLAEERRALAQAEVALEAALADVAARLPMLGTVDGGAAPLLLRRARAAPPPTVFESTMGLGLPLVAARGDAPAGVENAGLWSTPAWHEIAVEALDGLLALRLEVALRRRRAALIDAAVRRTLQRVNLFERRLIPQAQRAVREIRVYLGDQERAAIIRAKSARARLHGDAQEQT